MIFCLPMKNRISREMWEQAKTAYASGIGLRELARNMGISENTVLAHARREKWTQQIETAKRSAHREHADALSPMQSAAVTMQQRAERYTERMVGVAEKVLPHLESLEPGAILEVARNIEQFDRLTRRNLGLDSQQSAGGPINLALLIQNRGAMQIIAPQAVGE